MATKRDPNEFLKKIVDRWDNRPAQLEEINQCIYNHQNHDSYYCFDTKELLAQQTKVGRNWGTYNSKNPGLSTLTRDLSDVRYDFLILNVLHKEDSTIYTFSVRNTLWDGSYIVHKSNSNEPHPGDISVYTKEPNIIEFVVQGEDKNSIRICFHMSQQGDGRTIGTRMKILNEDVYSEQYNQTFYHSGIVIDTESFNGLNNVSVKMQPCDSKGNLLETGIPYAESVCPRNHTRKCLTGTSIYTGNDLKIYEKSKSADYLNQKQYKGVYTLPYGAVNKPGVYYTKITATYSFNDKNESSQQSVSKIIKVEKIQEQKRVFDIKSDYFAYKGSRKTFTFYVKVLNKYNTDDKELLKQLAGQIVSLTWYREDGTYRTYSSTIQKDGSFKVKLDFRRYYENTSKLQILLHETDGFDAISTTVNLKHKFYVANTFKEIQTACEDVDGPDYIMVVAKTLQNKTGQPITINRDQTIAGMKSNRQWATLDGTNNGRSLIRVKSGSDSDAFIQCNIFGIKFIHACNAIYTEKYTSLRVDKCYFTDNYSHSHHRGTCIMNESTEKARKQRDYYVTNILNSYFSNNEGNEILSLGKTYIKGNLFKTTQWKYLKQPEAKVVIVESGDVQYYNNKSYINMGTSARSTCYSWSKILTYVDYYGTFNGKGPNQLKDYNSLPVYGKYGNQAYTYATYYYPWNNVNSTIVCSPKVGHERHATGHASYTKRWEDRWAFYDGYYLIRWNNGRNKGNLKNPWTNAELKIPLNDGIYNPETGVFVKNYAPKYYGKSMTPAVANYSYW